MEVLIGIVEDEVVAIQHVDGRARQAQPSARATFVSQPLRQSNDCQPLTSQSEAMTLSKEKKSKLEHRIEDSRGTHQ